MDKSLYPMIFKRKSFHIFKDIDSITEKELAEIKERIKTVKPLLDNIKTEIVILKSEETTCKRGEEYCILFYSEKKDNYLVNIGYMGEQIDLILASMNIGALWFGIGRPKDLKIRGLSYIIMIAIAKVKENEFREDMYKSKRKPLSEIWEGDFYKEIGDIVRFSPSACNLQPWIVESANNKLSIYRYKAPGKRGIIPINKIAYYNRIDIGIFISFIELCLMHNDIKYEIKILNEDKDDLVEKVLIGEINLKLI